AFPRVSLLVPARDEGTTIASSLGAALDGDYPDLQVVAINDRSSDQTGSIIDVLAADESRLLPVHIAELPDGWLGKLNALQQGLEVASGEWVLFADADTMLAPQALRQAVAYAQRERLDLLTVYPELTSRSFFAGAVFALAPVLAQLSMPMWQVSDPSRKAYAGMGAFILVRRSFLDASPGLDWLRLDVADDMALGLLVKSNGGRIGILNGLDRVRIEFYATYRDMVSKMQKNWWAIMARFSVFRGLALCWLMLWLALGPGIGLLPLWGGLNTAAMLLGIAGWTALTAASVAFGRWTGRPLVTLVFPQLGALLCTHMLLRACWIGRRIGGIEWRGVRYSSEELRPMQRVRV
ncbi:MAG: glycosyltransferase, partial [Myxococcales bacterium]|nr:glycosyltransferase [Myxococcales bacterium]